MGEQIGKCKRKRDYNWAEREGLTLKNKYGIPTRRQTVQGQVQGSTLDLVWERGEGWEMEGLTWQGSDHAIISARKKFKKEKIDSENRKGRDWKKLEKWAEDIAEGKIDGARAIRELVGTSAYEKTISLLKSCEKEFKVNERSKICGTRSWTSKQRRSEGQAEA